MKPCICSHIQQLHSEYPTELSTLVVGATTTAEPNDAICNHTASKPTRTKRGKQEFPGMLALLCGCARAQRCFQELSCGITNPSCQASRCALVAKPQWFRPISVLWGATGSYRHGLGDAWREKGLLRSTMAVYQEVGIDAATSSVILQFFIERRAKKSTEGFSQWKAWLSVKIAPKSFPSVDMICWS